MVLESGSQEEKPRRGAWSMETVHFLGLLVTTDSKWGR